MTTEAKLQCCPLFTLATVRVDLPPEPVVTQSRALRSIASDVVLECSSSDEDEVSLSREESRAEFPEVSLQLLDPSEWQLAAYGAFCREENIIILEARSILYAFQCAEKRNRRDASESFLTLLRWCWRSAEDAQTHHTSLSVMRRIFASGFRAIFVQSFRWIPSELNSAGKCEGVT